MKIKLDLCNHIAVGQVIYPPSILIAEDIFIFTS